MTTEEAFLADIRERPDDDAPRLIFADWLEDNDQADRAEFIRLMLQITPRAKEDTRALRDRAGELLVRNWLRWVAPLRDSFGPNPYEPWLSAVPSAGAIDHFQRGLVAELTLGAPQFLYRSGAIHRLTALTNLSLRQAGGVGKELAGCPELQWIRRLSFIDYYSSPLEAADAAWLARSPHLTRLRQLTLFRNNIGDAGASALAEAPWLSNLKALDLTENGLSSFGARCLAEAPVPVRLRLLSLSMNTLGDEGAAFLSQAPWLSRLEALSLQRTGVTSEGVSALRRRAPFVRIYSDSPLG